MGPIRALLCFSLLLLLIAAPTQPVFGQDRESCGIAVENAETYYRDGDFEDAVRLLEPCIDSGQIPDDLIVPGHRYMALARLQLGDIAGARLAVLRMVAREPAYEADAVQDPPAYQALVRTVRDQLDDPAFSQELEEQRLERVRREQDAQTASVPTIALYRQRRAVTLVAHTGLSSYGGERGVEVASPLADFVENAGLAVAFGMAYNVSPYFSIDLEYGASGLPTAHNQKYSRGDPAFPEVSSEESSSVLHTITTSVLARFLPLRPASPFARLGGGYGFMHVNDAANGAAIIDLGVGVDLRLAPTVGLLAELRPRFVFPADAIDLVDRSGRSDLVTSFRVGVSWQVAGL